MCLVIMFKMREKNKTSSQRKFSFIQKNSYCIVPETMLALRL